MKKVSKSDKDKLAKKLLKIQKKGFLSYKEYLTDEFINSADKKSKKKYSRYIEDQIVMVNKKVKKINSKL